MLVGTTAHRLHLCAGCHGKRACASARGHTAQSSRFQVKPLAMHKLFVHGCNVLMQAGGPLPLEVAAGYLREVARRQQGRARFSAQRIAELRRETEALQADVAAKRSAPLVRCKHQMQALHSLPLLSC